MLQRGKANTTKERWTKSSEMKAQRKIRVPVDCLLSKSVKG